MSSKPPLGLNSLHASTLRYANRALCGACHTDDATIWVSEGWSESTGNNPVLRDAVVEANRDSAGLTFGPDGAPTLHGVQLDIDGGGLFSTMVLSNLNGLVHQLWGNAALSAEDRGKIFQYAYIQAFLLDLGEPSDLAATSSDLARVLAAGQEEIRALMRKHERKLPRYIGALVDRPPFESDPSSECQTVNGVKSHPLCPVTDPAAIGAGPLLEPHRMAQRLPPGSAAFLLELFTGERPSLENDADRVSTVLALRKLVAEFVASKPPVLESSGPFVVGDLVAALATFAEGAAAEDRWRSYTELPLDGPRAMGDEFKPAVVAEPMDPKLQAMAGVCGTCHDETAPENLDFFRQRRSESALRAELAEVKSKIHERLHAGDGTRMPPASFSDRLPREAVEAWLLALEERVP